MLIDLIELDKINLQRDREAIKRFLQWVDKWTIEEKKELRGAIFWLKHKHPDNELWDIINYD